MLSSLCIIFLCLHLMPTNSVQKRGIFVDFKLKTSLDFGGKSTYLQSSKKLSLTSLLRDKLSRGLPKILEKQETGLLIFRDIVSKMKSNPTSDPDLHRDSIQLIHSRGFLAEIHEIVTKDGYTVTLHRIINPFNPNPSPRPILLQHGFFASGSSWLNNSPGGCAKPPLPLSDSFNYTVGNNLGFELSNFGFDVWLGNFRGTRYSLGHIVLDPYLNGDYWDFTEDDVVAQDLPAFIDYILETTRHETLGYVGHSFGAFAMFSLLSTRPELGAVIKPFIALSPTGRFRFQTPLRYMTYMKLMVKTMRHIGGPLNFPPTSYGTLTNSVCTYSMRPTCLLPTFLATGFSWDQFNYTRFPVYANSFDSISLQSFTQLVQNINAEKPQKFDFGAERNNLYYRQKDPPEYRLEDIRHGFTVLIHSRGDWMSDAQAVIERYTIPILEEFVIPLETFNHMDFFLSKDVGLYVNTKIVNVLFKLFDDYYK